MARKVVQKTSFLGGEAGPLLEGRSDLAQYQLGASKIENMIVLKNGAVTRRPGTRYVKNTVNDKPARLLPFIISYDDPTKMFVVEISLASSTSLTFTVIQSSTGTSATVSGGTITVDDSINLDEIQCAQSGEFLFMVHKSFSPKILYLNTALGLYVLSDYTTYALTSSRPLWYAAPFRDANISSTTLTIDTASVGTGRTITASAAFFDSGHVGAIFRHIESATIGYFKVTGFTDSTNVTVEVIAALGGTAGSTNWSEGAWSTYRGFPQTITFYNQRLVFGGNESQRDTFWMSQVSDYFQMSADTSGISDPLSFTLASDKLNQIRWMVGGKKLTIGTSSSEWVGTVTNDGTNLFVQFDEETTHGSAPVQPAKSAYTIPFVQRSGQSVREMVFNFDSDSYQATDLNLFGSHVGAPGGEFHEELEVKITQMAHQESPNGTLWVKDNLGRVFGLTRDRQQQIASWHSHIFGGENDERADEKPIVVSFCVAPSIFGTTDRLWLCVHRKINGTSKYHVEYVDDLKPHPSIEPFRQYVDRDINGVTYSIRDYSAFLDCASVTFFTPSASTAMTGLTRFAGGNAYFIAMNNVDADFGGGEIVYCGELAVNGSGEATLPRSAETVVVGLHADSIIRLLPIEGGDAPEINLNSEKAADSVAIRMHETWGLRIGKNRIPRKTGNEENETFEPIPFDDSTPAETPTFTGVKVLPVPSEDGFDASFALAMQEPWPCTILSLSTRVTSNEV